LSYIGEASPNRAITATDKTGDDFSIFIIKN